MLTENDIHPGEIAELNIKLNLLAELPVWRSKKVENHIDAQFNIPYVFSVLANKVEIGPSWQAPEILKERQVTQFMKKVRVFTELDDDAQGKPELEVVVDRGSENESYSREGLALVGDMTDDELNKKFMRNTNGLLNKDRAYELLEKIHELENIDDISTIFQLVLANV